MIAVTVRGFSRRRARQGRPPRERAFHVPEPLSQRRPFSRLLESGLGVTELGALRLMAGAHISWVRIDTRKRALRLDGALDFTPNLPAWWAGGAR